MYLPGILLFSKIALSDAFMWVGHCQASPGTWHNRNQIRNAKLVVPVRHEFGQSIDDTQIDGGHWRRKHLRSIELNYSKRPYFKEHFPPIAAVINSASGSLGELNCQLAEKMLELFGIKTPIYYSRNFKIEGHKTDMLISMCSALDCNEYLSNEGARDYVDEAEMGECGIKHRWLGFRHPVYDQGHAEFITNLSAIDLLFNCGPASGRIIREAAYVS